jgi:hypothetical protein
MVTYPLAHQMEVYAPEVSYFSLNTRPIDRVTCELTSRVKFFMIVKLSLEAVIRHAQCLCLDALHGTRTARS